MSIKLKHRKLANGMLSLHLEINTDGKRKYHFLKLQNFPNPKTPTERKNNKQNLQLAQIKIGEIQKDIQNGEFGLKDKTLGKSNFVEHFAKLCSEKPPTEKAWRNTYKHLNDFTKGKIRISDVTEKFLNDFIKYLGSESKTKRAISQNTIHTYFSKIKASLKELQEKGVINFNPSLSIKVKKMKTKKEFLSLKEIEVLKNSECKDQNFKNAFLFSCHTGLRHSDITNLTWNEISEGFLYFRQQKTEEVERIKLSAGALGILEEQKEINPNSEKIFKLKSKSQQREDLKKWLKNASISKKITFHSARHTFATLCLTYGIDIYTVSKLLAHTNLKSTQIYANLIDKKKEEAITNKFPNF